jgi:hypothetical protein
MSVADYQPYLVVLTGDGEVIESHPIKCWISGAVLMPPLKCVSDRFRSGAEINSQFVTGISVLGRHERREIVEDVPGRFLPNAG